jgi:hypothetical protein
MGPKKFQQRGVIKVRGVVCDCCWVFVCVSKFWVVLGDWLLGVQPAAVTTTSVVLHPHVPGWCFGGCMFP